MKLPSMILFLTGSLLAVSNPLVAGDLIIELRACAAQSDDALRLACFDKLAAATSDRAAGPSEAKSQSSAASAAVVTTAEGFGLQAGQAQKPASPAPISRITSRVVKIEERSRGRIVVTLENDQVWEQVTPDPLFSLRPGDVVNIKSAAFGSYLLVAPSNRFTNVSRLH